MRAFHTLRSALALVVLAGASTFAEQQQTLQHVKDLYAQAAYEDALGALSSLPATEPATEVARYRAACLLALGRSEDAQKTVEEIVSSHPEYRPDPADTSPKIVELFRDARRAKVPDAARAMYLAAKGAMDRDEFDGAIERLETLVRLVDDPDFAGDATLTDLKMLAGGFLELTRVKKAEAAEKAEAARPESNGNGAGGAASKPKAAPPVITPATAIDQQLPGWLPPAGLAQWEFSGAVRLNIGVDGSVVDAKIERPIHPSYDERLLAAARTWKYQPARRDGVPIPSEMTVQVLLKPR
jgi:TonB family protein